MPIDSIKENTNDPYVVSVSPNCPQGHLVQFRLVVNEGWYLDTFNFNLVVGKYHYLVWNPDPTPTPGQTIHNTLNALGYSGAITTNLLQEPDLNIYNSIFICCGVYPNNYRITANSAEAIAITNYLNNGGRVYLEGGEVWYYDPQVGGHNFGPLFGIQGVSDGSADMGPVVGVNNTFTQGMYFNYAGENNYMDRINATTGFVIFVDGNNSYNCGVAYNAGIYRTVGTSFELGGLVDASAPSTKAILLDSIMRFFGTGLTVTEENQNNKILRYELKTYPNIIKSGELTKIYYSYLSNQSAKIKIYNALGRCVRTLSLDSKKDNIFWNGTDDNNRYLPTGVYFIQLDLPEKSFVNRIVILN
ncbi:MAG: T9SS type A sorting domain-containing protein [candidate division WOR-3 bacterium]